MSIRTLNIMSAVTLTLAVILLIDVAVSIWG
jgi:hypothetical protein